MRQQHKADHHAPHHVSHHHLQKGEVGVIGKSGNADDSEDAGLGSNNGKRDRPPGNVSSCEKVVAQRTLSLAEPQPEQGDPYQIQRDNREIEFVEAHIGLASCQM